MHSYEQIKKCMIIIMSVLGARPLGDEIPALYPRYQSDPGTG
jgi:hypothetical protein